MPATRLLIGIAAIFGAFVAGCGKAPRSTSAAQTNASNATRPRVADPPARPVSLLSMPVAVLLPAGWALDPPEGPIFIKGEAPDGKLRISLSMLDSMDSARRDRFVAAALDQSEKHPQAIQIRQLTSKNGMQIIERVTYSSAAADSSVSLRATTQPSDRISWSIILFVPYNKRFIPCSFDLFGLSQDQYRNDEQLVESIVDSAEPGKFPVLQ